MKKDGRFDKLASTKSAEMNKRDDRKQAAYQPTCLNKKLRGL
jgi:hypothetical protein